MQMVPNKSEETEARGRELFAVMEESGAELGVEIRSAKGLSPLGNGRKGKEPPRLGSVGKGTQGTWGRKRTGWCSLVLNRDWIGFLPTPRTCPGAD